MTNEEKPEKPKSAKKSPAKKNHQSILGTSKWIDNDEIHQVKNSEHLIEKESVLGF